MSFNPPQFPAADETYQYGNIIWQFDGTAGVWNIVDGSLVGEQGPPGPVGPQGPQGEKGNTGSPATGDNASIIVSNGFITARLGAVGTTGVLGVSNRFSVVNGIAYPLPASNGASGIASFDSVYFDVTSTGHVSIKGDLGVGGVTGDTVLGGVAIGVVSEGGNVKRINNIGVTSFNGLTGAVTLTGDGGAVFGAANNIIGARLADTSTTGVASFNSSFFSVNGSGVVSLASPYSVVGVTGIGFGDDVGLTGKINLTAADASMTITRSGNTISFASNAVGGAAAGITASPQQVLFSSGNGGTGSDNFVFNGLAATFGGANTQFTITGPTFTFSPSTRIKEGVFVNPSEFAPWDAGSPLGLSNLQVRASDGTVQRYTATPNSNFTISADSSGGWSNQTGVVETVIVAIQSLSGLTGQFGSDIVTEFPRPILLGVTGGIDVLSIMRIKTAGGGVTMGFVVSRGMTAAGVKLSD